MRIPRIPKANITWLTPLAIILIPASGYGMYCWQHGLVVNSNTKIAILNSQIDKLNGSATSMQNQIKSLQDQYNQAKATLDSYQAATKQSQMNSVIKTQADLDLTINGAQYINPDGTVTESGKWLGVNVTITNNTSNTISIHDSDFHLKDLQNNVYQQETMIGGSTMPTGWVGLADTTLAPGESIRGTVEFQMPNETVKDFTFVNVTKSFSVHSSN